MDPPGPAFAAGIPPATLRMSREDGWGPSEYKAARMLIQHALGAGRRLLGGDEGFAPEA